MNSVVLIGNLGKDPESRTTGGGMVVVTMAIATTDRRKKDGEWVEETQWHRVVVFGKIGENCARFLKKGSKVGVQGKIKYRTWDKDDGTKGHVTEIVADSAEFLSAREGGGNGGGGGGESTRPAALPGGKYDAPDADDLPF